jgi:hypothetical protein
MKLIASMTSDQYMLINNTLTKQQAANGCFFDLANIT